MSCDFNCDGKELSVVFPKNIFNGTKEHRVVYKLNEDGFLVNEKNIRCPKYSTRILIGVDLLHKCNKHQVKAKDFMLNGNKIKNLRKLVTSLKPEFENDDAILEISLYKTLLKIMCDKYEEKDFNDKLDAGFELINLLMSCEGIKC